MPCKEVTCCDEDDFVQSSSGEGNCPAGWQWDGTSCVRCPIQAPPSLTLSAGQVDMTFNITDGLNYRLERQEMGHWMALDSSVGGGPATYQDTTVTPGTMYSYRITVEQSEECGYIEGESVTIVAI